MKTIPQFEMQWDQPEGFRLVQETVPDWERIRREQEEAGRQRAEADKQQTEMQL